MKLLDNIARLSLRRLSEHNSARYEHSNQQHEKSHTPDSRDTCGRRTGNIAR